MDSFIRNSRETLVKNKWYQVHRDEITNTCSENDQTYYVIDFEEESVGIVVTNERNELLFVQALRYITNEFGLEIPAGGVEKGEDLVAAAKRECYEEAGYSVSVLKKKCSFYPCNGVSNQRYNVVFGKLSSNHQAPFDKGETVGTTWLPINEVVDKIRSGVIHDGPTITAVLLFIQEELSGTI